MILLLLLAGALYVTYAVYKDTEETGPTVLMGLVMHGAAFALLLMFSIFFMDETHRTDHTYNIYSIKRENVVDGSFFLGSGSIDTSRDYIFYYKDTDDFFRLGSVPTRKSRIKECEVTDGFIPYARYQTIYYNTAFWYSFGLGCSHQKNTMTDLYVPVGTIIQEFKL
jgi:hypothetical protein